MRIRIIKVPYDTGQYEVRMGRGPGRILSAGAVARLEALGHDVTVTTVDPEVEFPAEVATAFAVMGSLAGMVRDAVTDAEFPLVLAGNCNSTVGVVAGLSPRKVGVVWLDGHADLETPDTTTSGFIDGMGLAILTGRCWRSLAGAVKGFTPVPDRNVILAGASDIEPCERQQLESSEIVYLSDQTLNDSVTSAELGRALLDLADRVDGIHLHVDLDVHDARIARANHFRPPGGLTPERLRQVIQEIGDSIPVLSVAITAYDPEVDPDGVTLASCLTLMETIAALIPRSNSAGP